MKITKDTFKRILLILIGSLISAISINSFIIPHHLLSGGVTGVALIVRNMVNAPVGLLILLLNIPLFIIGTRKIDKDFIVYSLIGVLAVSLFLILTIPLQQFTLVQDKILSALAGGVVSGIGIGIVFRARASQGGFSIITVLINKKYGFSMATFTLFINTVIIFSGMIINKTGLDIVILTFLTVYISGIVMEKVIEGLDHQKMLLIITSEGEAVSEGLMKELGRGVTSIYGEGGYTGDKKKVIYCFLTLTQISKAKNLIDEIDQNSFVVIMDTSEIHGKGFKRAGI